MMREGDGFPKIPAMFSSWGENVGYASNHLVCFLAFVVSKYLAFSLALASQWEKPA